MALSDVATKLSTYLVCGEKTLEISWDAGGHSLYIETFSGREDFEDSLIEIHPFSREEVNSISKSLRLAAKAMEETLGNYQ